MYDDGFIGVSNWRRKMDAFEEENNERQEIEFEGLSLDKGTRLRGKFPNSEKKKKEKTSKYIDILQH